MNDGRILFFDTETTGKANMKGSPADPDQPHLVQLGAVLTSYAGDVLSQVDLIVEPDGWIIPPEAIAVHGISNELALAVGIPLRVVLSIFVNLCKKSTIISAHNLDFDELIIRANLHKVDQRAAWEIRAGHLIKICTMKQATPHCKIPNIQSWAKPGDFKWPSLEEAHQFYLGKPVKNAHKAMSDCVALANIFGEMKRRGHIVGVRW